MDEFSYLLRLREFGMKIILRKREILLAQMRPLCHIERLMSNRTFKLLAELTSNKSTRFVSFTHQSKGTGEIARHTIRFGASIENAYRKDLAKLEKLALSLSGVALEACNELIASLRESLTKGVGNNSAYTSADVYASIAKGVKVHKETGEIYVSGFSRAKVTLQAGVEKKVKSSEKTIAKNKLRRLLLSGKFRQFSLPATLSARVNGKELVFE
jgi:hypothetical protein